MELQDYLNVIRKRWVIIVAVTLVALGLAAAWTALTPRTYAATTQFFVNVTGSGQDNPLVLQQSSTFSQAQVKTYALILQKDSVLGPVIDAAGVQTTPAQLAGRISSSVPLETSLIDVTVTARSPAEAERVAQALTIVFPQVVARFQSGSANESPVSVKVTQSAQADLTPVNPRPTRNLALGLVLGLMVGLGVALLREVLDKSVKSKHDLTSVTDRTLLGTIAFDADAAQHPLIVQVDPRSQRAEAFRALRTNLQFIDVAHPPKSIVVTSSLAGEGKSTTSANLALSLAETGHSVVVIEGDLRRPRLLDYFGFEGSVGLTDVLVGRLDIDDVLQPVGRGGLRLLGAGPIPPNPSELLGSANMERLVDELTERYDYVLVDAPPLLPVTDAAVLSTVVDGALVVVGAGVAQREHVRRAIETLEAVNGSVLGLILNRVKSKDGGSGYGAYEYDYRPDSERQHAKKRSPHRSRGPVSVIDHTPVTPRSGTASFPAESAPAAPDEAATVLQPVNAMEHSSSPDGDASEAPHGTGGSSNPAAGVFY